jgi:hypothetical protein
MKVEYAGGCLQLILKKSRHAATCVDNAECKSNMQDMQEGCLS